MCPAIPASSPVHPNRIRILSPGPPGPPSAGPVVYWMFRDQRLRDNWALLHAAHLAAAASAPLAVAFALFPGPPFLLGARARHLLFMLRSLRRLLLLSPFPFFLLLHSPPSHSLPALLRRLSASALVADFSPLRPFRSALDHIVRSVGADVAVHQVDAHNVVPVWAASDHLEYSARTLRSKIHRLLPEYLVEFPELPAPAIPWTGEKPLEIDWDELFTDINREVGDAPEITWCEPGEDAAMETLLGTNDGFLTKRIRNYDTDRNDPTKPRGLSGLSPYLHFGQISAQRCALEARARRSSNPKAVDAFLEELIVRRELADNFCYYQPKYDSLDGAWEWARKTLMEHAVDKREHIYTREQLEKAQTADPLWNASQLEMVYHGKMHGFMRMYWAKKILEWTNKPEEALSIAIYLNDKYEIDGRDPNGYVGCMWSICGVHDQGWKERPVFGKIRYMNYAGCKRKFDVDAYISYVNRLVGETKKRKPENPLSLLKKKHSKSER
ncbi:deoxyribodipyrimidine photo-lyase isoform X1 [Ananas comosus]|uniref:Deoxyribodipyrimidine photo-lyase n=1 Tax=Ananas comosus TaxID=4615 RepID=A0A6P5FN80_ANACO|nr:deoxyribodipyrimidine photo-lyase isoform X1 [Ananas comosus]